MNAYYAKSKVAVTTTDWTAIVAPIDANYFGLRNTDADSALLVRTDMNDPQTEDLLNPGDQETVTSAPNLAFISKGMTRFPQGSTACWVQAVAGVGPVIVTWVL